MLRKWGTVVLFLLATPVLALAQNTGKLSGVVMDASTNEPLPGANVVIMGTQLGTATDVDGTYFILGVPAGVYDIQASFVGYQTVTVSDVEVNAGYTREQDFTLAPGAELDEIVVEYERPLIQKDALGVPKITSAEQIANLPVRGVANVAALQAGVVKAEGSDDLFIRGGREQEVTYYVDGVKVVGAVAVPDQAIQEQEMLVGAIPAKYGDAMSGIISVTTKSGAPSLFGSIEAITSEVLDSYGYNDVQATIGGPIIGDRLQFFLSGEYGNFDDASPRAIEFPTLSSADRELIQNNPQSIRIVNGEGQSQYIPFPSDIANGAAAEEVLAQIDLPEGWEFANEFPTPTYTANTFTEENLEYQNERPGAGSENLILNGNLQISPVESVRLRVGGGWERFRGKEFSFTRSLYAPEAFRDDDRDTWRVFGSWTQYLSNSTFFQLEANYSDYQSVQYSPLFSDDPRDLLFYGDREHPANAAIQRYFTFDPEDSTYVWAVDDGEELGSLEVQNNWSPYGVLPASGFTQRHYNRLGFRANATTQIGIHQIEFGGEFEKQTQRYFSMSGRGLPANLAKYYNDGALETPVPGSDTGVDRYEDLPFGVVDDAVFYYGYNYLGTEEVDDQNVNLFTGGGEDDANRYNVAPYEPIYYAGYVQDKIEYRDLVVNIGVRLDVFDNNSLTLRDPFALYPIVRAGEQEGAPSNIADDYAVYFNTSGNVVGYRDLEGNFYDTEGQNATPEAIRALGRPTAKENRVTEEVFEDYDPEVTFQPRIGLSFPVTDQALFFASYNVISQRPSENQFDTIQQWNQAAQQSKLMNNAGLRPQTTTTYELGFRQRVGENAALQISGFYKQIENLISRRIVHYVFPGNYQTYHNVDFGTVKGVEFEFDLRRTNNVALNANYTLSFAEGTGSDAATTAQIVWRMEEAPFYPRFISPLDFDQRHRANISLDYRLGENEGPQLFGGYPLSNFGFNVVGTFGSGLPFTKRRNESPIYDSMNGFLLGEINGESMPFSSLVNLRVDRRFSLGGSNLVVYLWVQNLFNQDNVTNVYTQTGLADDDAYLTNSQGKDYVAGLAESSGPTVAQSFEDHYRAKLRNPFNYGVPRTTRLGVRLDF